MLSPVRITVLATLVPVEEVLHPSVTEIGRSVFILVFGHQHWVSQHKIDVYLAIHLALVSAWRGKTSCNRNSILILKTQTHGNLVFLPP